MKIEHNGGTVKEWRGEKNTISQSTDGAITDADLRERIEDAIDDYTASVQTFITSVEVLRSLLSRLQPPTPNLTGLQHSASRMSLATPNSPHYSNTIG